MNYLDAASLVNLLGFAVAIALYGMLSVMVIRNRRAEEGGVNLLLIVTSLLGLIWNTGELFVRLTRDFSISPVDPFIEALSYSALGFLPSVVVHSAQAEEKETHLLTYAAYCSSTIAALLHFQSYFSGGQVPSSLAFTLMSFSALGLLIGLIIRNFKETLENKSIWTAALLIFVASSLHLGGNREGNSWLIELIAHQSSLPLIFVILYQNYRFAFADLFLKRALSLILVASLAFGLYIWIASPLLKYHETHDRNDAQAISLILVLWIATALSYPALHRLAVLLVDKVILKRADYRLLQGDLAQSIEEVESVEGVLDEVSTRLGKALTANTIGWRETTDPATNEGRVDSTSDSAIVHIRTNEPPGYELEVTNFQGGRRLLSDEVAMLDAVALLTARRIDAVRVTHERFEREFREEEFSKLAAEAQLTALRSQINPHFLFNTLTTIGYLIRTAPEKASLTLLHLTKLLRGVLSSTSEFCSLGDEIQFIENYLDIERARFEERLRVRIDIPADIESVSIPSLILQPLVENAIKHAVSENKTGGEVRIGASLRRITPFEEVLTLTVSDTGSGRPRSANGGASTGTGLNNIRQRLESYYGSDANLSVHIVEGVGATATVTIPIRAAIQSS